MRTALVGVVAIGCTLVAGCGHGSSRNSWCGLVKQHHGVFATKNFLDKGALDEFLRIAKAAPPAIRPDVLEVRDGVIHFYTSDPKWVTNKKKVDAWLASWKRLDAYLQQECDVQVPNPHKGQAA